MPDGFDIKIMINIILKNANAENKRARTMDIDDFIRYKLYLNLISKGLWTLYWYILTKCTICLII